jgi:hypothetical protein
VRYIFQLTPEEQRRVSGMLGRGAPKASSANRPGHGGIPVAASETPAVAGSGGSR